MLNYKIYYSRYRGESDKDREYPDRYLALVSGDCVDFVSKCVEATGDHDRNGGDDTKRRADDFICFHNFLLYMNDSAVKAADMLMA